MTLPPFRTYLKIEERYGSSSTQKSPLRISVMVDGIIDGTTGIDKAMADSQQPNGQRFNLTGQKVDTSFRGIIVKNGRKVLAN